MCLIIWPHTRPASGQLGVHYACKSETMRHVVNSELFSGFYGCGKTFIGVEIAKIKVAQLNKVKTHAFVFNEKLNQLKSDIDEIWLYGHDDANVTDLKKYVKQFSRVSHEMARLDFSQFPAKIWKFMHKNSSRPNFSHLWWRFKFHILNWNFTIRFIV